MTILLTGGLGKTTSRLASILNSNGHAILIASRSGTTASYPAVKFDWNDRSSWESVFESKEAKTSPISAVYLVIVGHDDPASAAKDFIKLAKEHGVKRIVFLSSSAVEVDSPRWMGQVHAYLKASNLEWTVLRPSWFMQNFSEQQLVQPVKDESRVVSATGDGKVPFVDAEDIAAVAAKALTVEQSYNTDLMVLGPELLSYGDVAAVLSDVLGRKITHTRLSQDEMEKYLKSKGLPDEVAEMLASLDDSIRTGAEDRFSDDVQRVLGRAPRSFREYAEQAKSAW